MIHFVCSSASFLIIVSLFASIDISKATVENSISERKVNNLNNFVETRKKNVDIIRDRVYSSSKENTGVMRNSDNIISENVAVLTRMKSQANTIMNDSNNNNQGKIYCDMDGCHDTTSNDISTSKSHQEHQHNHKSKKRSRSSSSAKGTHSSKGSHRSKGKGKGGKSAKSPDCPPSTHPSHHTPVLYPTSQTAFPTSPTPGIDPTYSPYGYTTFPHTYPSTTMQPQPSPSSDFTFFPTHFTKFDQTFSPSEFNATTEQQTSPDESEHTIEHYYGYEPTVTWYPTQTRYPSFN